ncbi:MAG: ribonuclease III domain-containing protein [Eubacterium sp.]|nr:ribonuclease III domain-containing protein [Eubacterium sp.]
MAMLEENFGPFEKKAEEQVSPLTLAYIGDAFYEIIVRTVLVRQADRSVNKLHRAASALVKAEKQSEMIGILEPMLTDAEQEVYHRGRNAKSYTKAKNASIVDYRRATGFEAVMGYLFLKGEISRAVELIRKSI